jgi:hypothetical protein
MSPATAIGSTMVQFLLCAIFVQSMHRLPINHMESAQTGLNSAQSMQSAHGLTWTGSEYVGECKFLNFWLYFENLTHAAVNFRCNSHHIYPNPATCPYSNQAGEVSARWQVLITKNVC